MLLLPGRKLIRHVVARFDHFMSEAVYEAVT